MNNPFIKSIDQSYVADRDSTATYKGITIKTFYFLGMTILGALLAIFMIYKAPSMLVLALVAGLVVGLVSGFLAYRSPSNAKVFGSIYCVCQGITLGAVCFLGEMIYPGAFTIAVVTTVAVFAGMLALFASGLIRNKAGLYKFGITLGFCAIFTILASTILSIFPAFREIFNNPGIIIAIELLILVYACTTLLISFNEATETVKSGVDKSNEWVCAFGLAFSILYIFLEVLRIVYYLYELFGDN